MSANNQGERVAWESWSARAARVLAGGCLTFSKARRYYVEAQPSHVLGGYGAYLQPFGGGSMLDTVSGLGANLCSCDNVFSLPTTIEVEFAELLLRRIPFERVKIVKTGTEACMAALRYMRAARPGQRILSIGYHGWSNEFISCEPNAVGCYGGDVSKVAGVKELQSAIIEDNGTIGGVLIEPVMLDASTEHIELLRGLLRLCKAKNILVCFDEVITGMRFPEYTVAQTYGIMPDLMILGKAIGGGHPLGLVLGPAEIMDREGVFVSGTFAGETSALQAGMGILSISPSELRQFYAMANDFHNKLTYQLAGKITASGYGTRIVFTSPQDDGLTVAKYMQQMYAEWDILIGPVFFPKVSWTNDTYTKILGATADVMQTIDKVELVGEKPRPVFKRNA